jgi:hypothetical protein
MTDSVVVDTVLPDSSDAGAFLGARIRDGLGGARPDAVLLFAPPSYDYATLVHALGERCAPKTLVGGSGVGGFTARGYLDERAACAVAIRSSSLRFCTGVGRELRRDPRRAAHELVSTWTGLSSHAWPYRSAIVLVDALVGHADAFLDHLMAATGRTYQLFGGGAADGARMSRSQLLCGTDVLSDCAVGLEILSDQPLGVGLCQGWRPVSAPLRVTEADGNRVLSLNGLPALDTFREHAAQTGQRLDLEAPVPFFLDNILGLQGEGGFKFRVPVAANPDGSVTCAAEVPTGAIVRIMSTSAALASSGAAGAIGRAREQLGARRPHLAVFFDCLASKLRLELGFGFDPRALGVPLGTTNYAGFSTCGQVVRTDGELDGFQNCTAVVCVFPE